MVIDASTHVWSSNVRRYPLHPLDLIPVPDRPASCRHLLADLDAIGAQAAVAIQPRVYGYDHAYLRQAIKSYPNRIVGVCLIDPRRPTAPADLERLVNHDGFRGLRLISLDGTGLTWLGTKVERSLLERAEALNIPLGLLLDPPRLQAVAPIAESHPGLTIIVDHLGRCRPSTPEASRKQLLALARFANVHVKISGLWALSAVGFPYSDLHPLIKSIYDAFGPDRMLWGSDYPYCLDGGPYQRTINALLSATFIANTDLDVILGWTTARLYGIGSAA